MQKAILHVVFFSLAWTIGHKAAARENQDTMVIVVDSTLLRPMNGSGQTDVVLYKGSVFSTTTSTNGRLTTVIGNKLYMVNISAIMPIAMYREYGGDRDISDRPILPAEFIPSVRPCGLVELLPGLMLGEPGSADVSPSAMKRLGFKLDGNIYSRIDRMYAIRVWTDEGSTSNRITFQVVGFDQATSGVSGIHVVTHYRLLNAFPESDQTAAPNTTAPVSYSASKTCSTSSLLGALLEPPIRTSNGHTTLFSLRLYLAKLSARYPRLSPLNEFIGLACNLHITECELAATRRYAT